MKHPIILYIMCLCLFLSCGDDEKLVCKETELVSAPQAFLSYWYFPKGSYWIYKLKDTNGVYDTMRVVSDYKLYCNRGQSNDPDCVQAPCTWVYSNMWEHSNEAFFRVGGGCPTKGINNLTSYFLNSDQWLVQGSGACFPSYFPPFPFKFPFTIGEKYMGNNQLVSIDTLYTSTFLFPKTVRIRYDYGIGVDSINGFYVKDIYLCPNVGVVKWNYSQSGVWELVEYDVTP